MTRAKGLRRVAVVVATLGMTGGVEVAAQWGGIADGPPSAWGRVAALDVQRGALKLDVPVEHDQPGAASAPPTTFLLEPQTTISKGAQQLTLEELKVGDQVMIEYGATSGRNVAVARSITVQAHAGHLWASSGEE
ncbi:MAG: hypothetical protein Q8R91_10950 [Candidatus Omnitrophota bacterium]|nr:hypothetical protein [Candidatus Omnitrophota bacterium]